MAYPHSMQIKSNLQLISHGNRPAVIAGGGFSGLFPDPSSDAYDFAKVLSVSDLILWCDVQLTKDAVGICFLNLNLEYAYDISQVLDNRSNTYPANGVAMEGSFTVDFSLDDLQNVSYHKEHQLPNSIL